LENNLFLFVPREKLLVTHELMTHSDSMTGGWVLPRGRNYVKINNLGQMQWVTRPALATAWHCKTPQAVIARNGLCTKVRWR
jgi:hypothetical protein